MSLVFSKEIENTQMLITLEGRLDGASVREINKEIVPEIDTKTEIDEIIIDMEKLEYISSAGLRFVLSTQKKMIGRNGNLIVFKPTEDVINVFKSTEFDKFLNIVYSDLEEIKNEDHHVYPLRPIQRWMMDTHFNRVNSTMMNAGGLVRLDESINLDILKTSVETVLQDHDIFKCRFVADKDTGEICQRFDGEIGEITIEKMSDEEFENSKKTLKKIYKLTGSQLWNIRLIHTDSAQYIFVDFYHGILDGVAIVLLFWREIDKYYKSLLGGKTVDELRRIPTSYAAYIREELSSDDEETMKEGINYWKAMTEGFSKEKHLPHKDSNAESEDAEEDFPFDSIDKAFFKDKPFSEHCFFMGAAMLTMAKVTGEKEVIMSWVHNGRTNGKEFRLMGIMLEQFPIRWSFSEDEKTNDFLSKLEDKIKEETLHRRSLGTVYEEGVQINFSCFILQKGAIGRHGTVSLGGIENQIEELPQSEESASESAMDIELNEHEDGTYSLVLDYDAGLYSYSAMKNFADTMQEIIRKMKENSGISDILK